MGGPLELLYSVQALICAAACVGVTKAVKAAIDVWYGKEKRKRTPWLQTLLLPMVPILVGALFAAFVPLRPNVLIEYVTEQEITGLGAVATFAAWGAACGQFATMLHQKLKDYIQAVGPEKPTA